MEGGFNVLVGTKKRSAIRTSVILTSYSLLLPLKVVSKDLAVARQRATFDEYDRNLLLNTIVACTRGLKKRRSEHAESHEKLNVPAGQANTKQRTLS